MIIKLPSVRRIRYDIPFSASVSIFCLYASPNCVIIEVVTLVYSPALSGTGSATGSRTMRTDDSYL